MERDECDLLAKALRKVAGTGADATVHVVLRWPNDDEAVADSEIDAAKRLPAALREVALKISRIAKRRRADGGKTFEALQSKIR